MARAYHSGALVYPHPSRADQRPALMIWTLHHPRSVEVEQDLWHCLPAALPSPRDGYLLLYEMAVRKAKIHL